MFAEREHRNSDSHGDKPLLRAAPGAPSVSRPHFSGDLPNAEDEPMYDVVDDVSLIPATMVPNSLYGFPVASRGLGGAVTGVNVAVCTNTSDNLEDPLPLSPAAGLGDKAEQDMLYDEIDGEGPVCPIGHPAMQSGAARVDYVVMEGVQPVPVAEALYAAIYEAENRASNPLPPRQSFTRLSGDSAPPPLPPRNAETRVLHSGARPSTVTADTSLLTPPTTARQRDTLSPVTGRRGSKDDKGGPSFATKFVACIDCDKTLTFFEKKKHCHKCSAVLCTACGDLQAVLAAGKGEVRVCSACFVDAGGSLVTPHLVAGMARESAMRLAALRGSVGGPYKGRALSARAKAAVAGAGAMAGVGSFNTSRTQVRDEVFHAQEDPVVARQSLDGVSATGLVPDGAAPVAIDVPTDAAAYSAPAPAVATTISTPVLMVSNDVAYEIPLAAGMAVNSECLYTVPDNDGVLLAHTSITTAGVEEPDHLLCDRTMLAACKEAELNAASRVALFARGVVARALTDLADPASFGDNLRATLQFLWTLSLFAETRLPLRLLGAVGLLTATRHIFPTMLAADQELVECVLSLVQPVARLVMAQGDVGALPLGTRASLMACGYTLVEMPISLAALDWLEFVTDHRIDICLVVISRPSSLSTVKLQTLLALSRRHHLLRARPVRLVVVCATQGPWQSTQDELQLGDREHVHIIVTDHGDASLSALPVQADRTTLEIRPVAWVTQLVELLNTFET